MHLAILQHEKRCSGTKVRFSDNSNLSSLLNFKKVDNLNILTIRKELAQIPMLLITCEYFSCYMYMYLYEHEIKCVLVINSKCQQLNLWPG